MRCQWTEEGGRDEGEGRRRRKNEIVAERCRHEEEKHFNSRCLLFNARSISLCNSVLVSRCEWKWKEWDVSGNQPRPVSLGSAIFCVSSCCYRWFCGELSVAASRWTSEVMQRTFKVWLQKKKKNRTLSTEHFHSVLLVPVCSCSLPFCTRAHSPYLHTNLSGSIGAYRPFGIFSGFPLLCQCSSAVSRTKLTRSKKCSGYTHSLHFKEAFLLPSIQSDSWSMTWWTPMYLFCSLYILTYCIRLVFDL